MRVLIVSDTHRRHTNLEYVLEKIPPIDLLIHLGDAEGYEDEIQDAAGCPLEIVAGNNDFFSQLDSEKVIILGSHRVFLTHGHHYCVEMGLADIQREAEARACDVVMFGHTHRPVLLKKDNLLILNPGSISYPRQEGRVPSYMVMKIDKKGEIDVSLEYLW